MAGPSLEIYREQWRYSDVSNVYNYVPDDVVYRSPLLVGGEPPLRVLFPVVKDDGEPDPYAVFIGYTLSGKPFAYSPRIVVNPLVLIVGTPGAGKSASVMTFIYNWLLNEELEPPGKRHPPVVVVDPEGEYERVARHLNPGDALVLHLGRKHFVNIFDRPSKSIDPRMWYARMTRVVLRFLNISEAQAPQAYRAFKRAVDELVRERGFTDDPATWDKPDITLREIYEWLSRQVEVLERQKKNVTQSERIFHRGANTLLSRLDSWMYPPENAFSVQSNVDLAAALQRYKLIVFNARNLPSSLYGLFTYFIVYWFYGLLLEWGPLPSFGIRVVLVIDEAWALLKKDSSRREENPLEALARRGRKYGILLVVATQTPEDMDEKMFSLFGAVAVGSLRSDRMVEKLVRSLNLPERYSEVIKSLSRGTLVWSLNWARKDFEYALQPIIVKTAYPFRDLAQVE